MFEITHNRVENWSNFGIELAFQKILMIFTFRSVPESIQFLPTLFLLKKSELYALSNIYLSSILKKPVIPYFLNTDLVWCIVSR